MAAASQFYEASDEPVRYTSGRLELTATAIDSIHHGGGTEGNVQVLRTQKVPVPVYDEGGQPVMEERFVGGRSRIVQAMQLVDVPFISGNSLKHAIRDAAVRYALEVMGVRDGSLSKAVCDLLFSGGHLSSGGQAIDLGRSRRLAEIFPVLSLCGYSAGNTMVGSKLMVSNLHMVCEENTAAGRVPARLLEHPHAWGLTSWDLRGEEFGTRHEASRSPHVSRMLTHESRAALEDDAAARLDAKVSRKKAKESKSLAALDAAEEKSSLAHAKGKDTSQMIYTFEVVKAGAVFFGDISYLDLTEGELAAFRSGLSYACLGRHDEESFVFALGAKASVGWGRVAVRFENLVRAPIMLPREDASDALVPIADRRSVSDELHLYTERLRLHRAEILSLIEGMA